MKRNLIYRTLLMSGLFFSNKQLAQAQGVLDLNNVRATVAADGVLFLDGYSSGSGYEVPKFSGKQAISAAGLWVGGTDQNNQLHISASTYRQNGTDFNFGLFDTINLTCSNSSNGNAFNKVFALNCSDLDSFFNNGVITANVLNWPAHGDISLNEPRNLAPYIDVNGDGYYNPVNGDYPVLTGDKMLFWVMSDICSPHTETNGQPLGIRVACSVYAYEGGNANDTLNAIANTTFYRFAITNNSTNTYNNSMISFFADPDLGNPNDDRLGCNPDYKYAFAYNDSLNDGVYGSNKMMLSVLALNGPLALPGDGINNDRDSVLDMFGNGIAPLIDEPGEEMLFDKFMYFNNAGSLPVAMTAPLADAEYFNYMNGLWRDGTALIDSGTGYTPGGPAPGSPIINYAFANNSYMAWTNPLHWTDVNSGMTAGDRKMLISQGPFTFLPGQTEEVIYAVIFSNDSSAQWNSANFSMPSLRDVKIIDRLFNSNGFVPCATNTASGIEHTESNTVSVYPNPAQQSITIDLRNFSIKSGNLRVVDLSGKTLLEKRTNGNATEQIDVSRFSEGVYFIQVLSENSVSTKKLIIQR